MAASEDKLTVYAVYRGKLSSDRQSYDHVCTRLNKEDAESIAQILNEAQEGVMYLKWLASVGFTTGTGNGDALLAAAETDEAHAKWESFVAAVRKPIFQVAALQTATADENEALKKELLN
jgi:hypothetical protein